MDEQPQEPESERPRRRRYRRFFLTGLATLLPTLLTAYIVYVCYRFVHNNLGYWIARVLAAILGQIGPDGGITNPWTVVSGDVAAVVVVLGLAFAVGAFAGSIIGRRFVRLGEKLLERVPFVKLIYPHVKQVVDFLFKDRTSRFGAVVAVPYPRRGLYSVGFVTGMGMRSINEATGEDMIHVFIPSSPTPITGYVVFVPKRDVIVLPVTVDEVLRFSISAGVLVPPQEVVEEALAASEEEQPLLHGPEAETADEEDAEEDEEQRSLKPQAASHKPQKSEGTDGG